jgi:hypothetical protein
MQPDQCVYRHRRLLLAILLLVLGSTPAVSQTRWHLTSTGGIGWDVTKGDLHHDEIEMSGQRVSVTLGYTLAADRTLSLHYNLAFPALRNKPNLTGDTLHYTFAGDAPIILIDGKPIADDGPVTHIGIRGLVTIDSNLDNAGTVTLRRIIFPSVTRPAVFENDLIINHSSSSISVDLEGGAKTVLTPAALGVYGAYRIESRLDEAGARTLKPGEEMHFSRVFTASRVDTPLPPLDPVSEETARRDLVAKLFARLQLQTPDPALNTAFAFAKLRTAESIYQTRGGLMHSPGGGSYYAAIWANDESEYSSPFFPFLGYRLGDDAMINAFHMFSRYMNPAYRPIPSSIISEGISTWSGAGDRGDMAMLAYGAGRFALAYGDRNAAERLWPLITWSLEYCRRHLSPQGVVISDSDELEGRVPSGKTNLNTSSLYYDALRSAVFLGRSLGKPQAQLDVYSHQADALSHAINTFFAATIDGFNTYRYSEHDENLRGWIATPLTMDLFAREAGTLQALFSPALWGSDGVVTVSGNPVFWDRQTLYALRGAFAANDTGEALTHLQFYTRRRLLGNHVPYSVETGPDAVGIEHAYQRQLAGESALYCRIYTEGLFGIRPTGLNSFTLAPHLPSGWETMSLRNIGAFGQIFDIQVMRSPHGLRVLITQDGKTLSYLTSNGAPAQIALRAGLAPTHAQEPR